MRTLFRSAESRSERSPGAGHHEPDGTTTRTRQVVRFVIHFLEMVIAMIAGMMLLGPLWTLAWPSLTDLADVHAIVMATNMTVGMALWMRIRRHSWASILDMSAAMYVPFLVLLVPYWLGLVSGHGLMMGGHILMLPVMVLAMLRRRCEYTG